MGLERLSGEDWTRIVKDEVVHVEDEELLVRLVSQRLGTDEPHAVIICKAQCE